MNLLKTCEERLTLSCQREAARKLFSVKQRKRRVTEYIIDFHTIAAESLWNEEALMDAFFQGLNNNIKDKLEVPGISQSFGGSSNSGGFTCLEETPSEQRQSRKSSSTLG